MKCLYVAFLLSLSAQVNCFPPSSDNIKIKEDAIEQRSSPPIILDRGTNWVDTKPHDFPFIARIEVTKEINSEGPIIYQCGGSLLNRRHILSAASCFSGQIVKYGSPQPDKVRVNVDDHTWSHGDDTDDNSFISDKVTLHPDFDKDNIPHDVAVIRIKRDVPEGVPSVCLRQNSAPDGTPVTVAGWGLMKYKAETVTKNLKKSSHLKVMSHEKCVERFPKSVKNNNVFCTYNEGPNGVEEACNGDEGDPMFYEEGGKFVQVGLFSFDMVCGMVDMPAYYIDISGYIPFIQKSVSSGGDVCVVD